MTTSVEGRSLVWARRRLYAPGFLIGAATIWLVWSGAHFDRSYSLIARRVSMERAQLVGPVILGFVLVVFVLERVCPAVRRPVLARGHVHDGIYLILYATAVVPLIALTGTGFAGVLAERAPWLELSRVVVLPRWSVVVLAVVLMDFCNWLSHLANHRVGALWRFHAVHHTQEELSILTSFRAHPLVHLSFLISAIPAFIFLSDGGLPSLIITAYVCLGALPHANVPWRFGPLGRLVVSPAYHRAHHAIGGRLDCNLGTVFTIWDVATGRAVFPSSLPTEPVPTGLCGGTIPLEQVGSRSRHLKTMLAQLLEPFTAVVVPTTQMPASEDRPTVRPVPVHGPTEVEVARVC